MKLPRSLIGGVSGARRNNEAPGFSQVWADISRLPEYQVR
jgi:hypothetical protein